MGVIHNIASAVYCCITPLYFLYRYIRNHAREPNRMQA